MKKTQLGKILKINSDAIQLLTDYWVSLHLS